MKKCVSVIAAILAAALLSGAVLLAGREPRADAAGELLPPETAGESLPTAPGDVDTADASMPVPGEEPPADTTEPAPGEEPPADSGGMTEEAAKRLHILGVMSGVGRNPDGTVDFALDKPITRQEAVTLIARAAGYDQAGADMDFPHPFEDVSDFAQGSVGFAYRKGITNGVSKTSFNAAAPMTGRELVTFMLRALGYGDDFVWSDACAFSDSVGLTDGELGQGLETVTRGDAAAIVWKLLTTAPKGLEKNYLSRLVETGALTRETVAEAGLESALYPNLPASADAGTLSESYKNSLVTLTARDILLKITGTAHGTVLVPGVVAAPLDAVKGSMYMTLTDSAGSPLTFTGILGRDEARGLVYLGYAVPSEGAVPAPLYASVAPGAGEENGGEPTEDAASGSPEDTAGDTSATTTVDTSTEDAPAPGDSVDELLYAVSDTAVAFARGEALCARDAAIITDHEGTLLGICTKAGVWRPEVELGAALGLYEYTAANWPELLPPVYPRGVDPTKPMTAVTYDDGPNATYTPMLLDILEQHGAVATFFEVGYRVERWPQFIPRMEAMHCEVANHTWDHAALRRLSREGVMSQVQRTDAVIEAVTGHKVNLMRCPGGNSNATVAGAVGHPIIYWTIDTRDWEVRVASNVIAHVKNDADLDGDIILMHSNYASTVEASRTIIPYILNKGYQTVTVTELAFFRGVELQNGVTYKKFPPK